MSESAEVLSVQALRDLDDALARFAAQALQVPDAVAPEIEKRVMALEERRYEAAREVRYWERRYDEAGNDEDTGSVASRLEEAESKLHEIERWQRRVEESHRTYQSAITSLKHLATDHTTKARTFLFQKEAELQAYLAAQPSHESPVSAGASTAQPDVRVSPSTRTANDAVSVDNLPLPKGFRWVPLEEIDQSCLPARKDFPEGSYDEFRRRLNLLRRKVLPVLKSKAHADRDHYHELDRRSGRVRQGLVHPDSLGRTYELFFGEDHIHLDRRREAVGERFYLLTYLGEGFNRVWFKGRLFDISIAPMLTHVPHRFVSCDKPSFHCWWYIAPEHRRRQSAWHVKVRLHDGVEGWTDQADNFGNKDACG